MLRPEVWIWLPYLQHITTTFVRSNSPPSSKILDTRSTAISSEVRHILTLSYCDCWISRIHQFGCPQRCCPQQQFLTYVHRTMIVLFLESTGVLWMIHTFSFPARYSSHSFIRAAGSIVYQQEPVFPSIAYSGISVMVFRLHKCFGTRHWYWTVHHGDIVRVK